MKEKDSILKTTFLVILFFTVLASAGIFLQGMLSIIYTIPTAPIRLLANYADMFGHDTVVAPLRSIEDTMSIILLAIGLICLPILMAYGKVRGEGLQPIHIKKKGEKTIYEVVITFFRFSAFFIFSLFSIYGLALSLSTVKHSLIYSLFFIVPVLGLYGLIFEKIWAYIYCKMFYVLLSITQVSDLTFLVDIIVKTRQISVLFAY